LEPDGGRVVRVAIVVYGDLLAGGDVAQRREPLGLAALVVVAGVRAERVVVERAEAQRQGDAALAPLEAVAAERGPLLAAQHVADRQDDDRDALDELAPPDRPAGEDAPALAAHRLDLDRVRRSESHPVLGPVMAGPSRLFDPREDHRP